MKRSILSLATAIVMCVMLLPTTALASNQPSTRAIADVEKAIANGLVPSDLQTNYQQSITRSEFCSLAVSLYEFEMGSEIAELETFTDTDDVNIQKMAGIGVISGIGDGLFAP